MPKNLYYTKTRYKGELPKSPKGYWAKKCSMCERKPIYCWWGRAFCREHKTEAWEWVAQRPTNIEGIIYTAQDKRTTEVINPENWD